MAIVSAAIPVRIKIATLFVLLINLDYLKCINKHLTILFF